MCIWNFLWEILRYEWVYDMLNYYQMLNYKIGILSPYLLYFIIFKIDTLSPFLACLKTSCSWGGRKGKLQDVAK